jgi:hypothetical protein
MVMLSKRCLLLAKAETTYGVDPTPTEAANALLVIDPQIKETFEAVERGVKLQTLTPFPSLAAMKSAEITFKSEIKGSGSVALAPRLGVILQACGFTPTVNSGVSVSYAPVSSSFTSITCWLYKDGRKHVINGCRGKSMKVIAEAGKVAMLEITLEGLYTAPTNVALPTPTYEAGNPVICKGTTFSYNSKTTLIASKLEVDMGLTLAKRPSLSATDALAGFEITDRNPTFSMDVEAQIETSYAFRTDALTTQRAVSYAIGSVAGNICTINITKANITSVEYGDNEGILMESLKGECSISSTGNDEVTLVFS